MSEGSMFCAEVWLTLHQVPSDCLLLWWWDLCGFIF